MPSEATLLAGIGTKKVMSFIVTNLTPENLANADMIANILGKAPKIANITGKVMQGIEKVMGAADSWYVKVLLAGPKLVAEKVGAPIARRLLEPKLGKETVDYIEKLMSDAKKGGKVAGDMFPDLVEFTKSETFKESAQALATGGKVLKSITSLLEGLAKNVSESAKNIEDIPPKEQSHKYDAISSLARRLDELGSMEPNLDPEMQEPVKKGYFAKIKEQFNSWVSEVKDWVTKLFTGDSGIPALEKKFAAAQKAHNDSPSEKNAKALVTSDQKLQKEYSFRDDLFLY